MSILFGILKKPTNVIMVSGVMRSGTSLLQRVLATAEGANPLMPEFEEIRKTLRTGQKKLRSQSQVKRTLRRKISDLWQEQQCPKILIAKDPLLTPLICPFVRLLPEVKNIISLRDPRDTVNSILAVREKMLSDNAAPRSILTEMSEAGVVWYVIKQILEIRKIRNEANVYVVRYELLVNRDPTLRDELSDFVGKEISFDPPRETNEFDKKQFFYSALLGNSPTDKRIGSHQDLPSHVQVEFQRYRDLLVDLGYEVGAKEN